MERNKSSKSSSEASSKKRFQILISTLRMLVGFVDMSLIAAPKSHRGFKANLRTEGSSVVDMVVSNVVEKRIGQYFYLWMYQWLLKMAG